MAAPRSSCRAVVLLTVLAVSLLVAARAGAVTPPEPSMQAAFADGRVVGLSTDTCGANLVLSALSDDRGATWRQGQCVPAGRMLEPDSDGVSVSYFTASAALLQLDANGAVSATWQTPPYLEMTESSGIDGGTAYMWSEYENDVVAVSAAGPKLCGRLSGFPGIGTDAYEISATGPLVVFNAFDGQQRYVVSSRDACASFLTTTLSADTCSNTALQPDGIVLCQKIDSTTRFDISNPDAGWTAVSAPISDDRVAYGLARGGLELHRLDAASTPWAPWTWPAPVRALGAIPGGAAPPSGPMAAALTFLNTQYRRPMGLADVVWQPQIALAAQLHTEYWVKNGTGTGLQPHDETPGKPGFHGADPGTRCHAAGAPADEACGEDAYPGVTVPVQAMAGWLGAPFHGAPLLTASHLGIGVSAKGSAADFDFSNYNGTPVNLAAGVNTYDYDAAPNTASATEHVWPADGAKNVPARWLGGEVPDPLTGYTGDHANVGPVLYYSTVSPVQVTLETASGAVVPLLVPSPVLVTHGLVQSVTSKGGFATEAVFAGRALDVGASYTLVLSPELPGLPEHRFTFTIAGSPKLPSSSGRRTVLTKRTKIAGCREHLLKTTRAGSRPTTYQFAASGCRPQALQIYRSGAWRAVRLKTIVVGRGTHARWRVVYRRRVIASGVLSA